MHRRLNDTEGRVDDLTETHVGLRCGARLAEDIPELCGVADRVLAGLKEILAK